MDREMIKALCDNDSYLRSKLYCRGFLITDSEINDTGYPFYDEWNKTKVDSFNIYNHKQLPCFVKSSGNTSAVLLGHAYDPFRAQTDENEILDALLENVKFVGREDFFEIINDLTGVFCIMIISGKKLMLLNDAVGLCPVYYTESRHPFFAASHINLIGDFAGFAEDPYVTSLKSCKTFYYFGNQLPGNITKFKEVKLLIPNHCLSADKAVELKRFYYPHYLEISDEEAVDSFCDIMKKSMRVIAEKWERPAVSLTGGCDSRTTLSAANGMYDRFSYFSYDSQPNEKPDADAAQIICKNLGLPHTVYNIPYSDDAFGNIEEIRQILIWNGGDIRDNNPNDVRKRAYLDKTDDFDVEVKSWASEIGRARYSKRYAGKRSFGKPTPRKCTTFYKFLLNRKIVNDTDIVFKAYLNDCFQQDKYHPIPWQDQFYWEWHWPSRDGITLTCEHMFSDVITVPCNNRRTLELLLSTSEENKYTDALFAAARERMDSRIDKAAESVVDVNHTKSRADKELWYYRINTLLPY